MIYIKLCSMLWYKQVFDGAVYLLALFWLIFPAIWGYCASGNKESQGKEVSSSYSKWLKHMSLVAFSEFGSLGGLLWKIGRKAQPHAVQGYRVGGIEKKFFQQGMDIGSQKQKWMNAAGAAVVYWNKGWWKLLVQNFKSSLIFLNGNNRFVGVGWRGSKHSASYALEEYLSCFQKPSIFNLKRLHSLHLHEVI